MVRRAWRGPVRRPRRDRRRDTRSAARAARPHPRSQRHGRGIRHPHEDGPAACGPRVVLAAGVLQQRIGDCHANARLLASSAPCGAAALRLCDVRRMDDVEIAHVAFRLWRSLQVLDAGRPGDCGPGEAPGRRSRARSELVGQGHHGRAAADHGALSRSDAIARRRPGRPGTAGRLRLVVVRRLDEGGCVAAGPRPGRAGLPQAGADAHRRPPGAAHGNPAGPVPPLHGGSRLRRGAAEVEDPRGLSVRLSLSRRVFVAGAVAAGFAQLATAEQSAEAATTIGFLSERSLPSSYIEALERGLIERGWAEGRGFRIEQRSADGDLERPPGLVAELIGIGVTLIVTGVGTPVALAAKRATAKVRGVTTVQKRLELLREVIPGAKRVAFLRNLTNPVHPKIFRAAQGAGRQLGLTLQHEVGVFEAVELEGVFKTLLSQRFDALLVPGDAMFSTNRAILIGLVARARLAAVYGDRLFPDAGGLMSVSVDLLDLCRRAAGHVDKILRGAQAGDLPVEEALTLEVVINFKATNALGLAIPASLRQRAEIVDRRIGRRSLPAGAATAGLPT